MTPYTASRLIKVCGFPDVIGNLESAKGKLSKFETRVLETALENTLYQYGLCYAVEPAQPARLLEAIHLALEGAYVLPTWLMRRILEKEPDAIMRKGWTTGSHLTEYRRRWILDILEKGK